MTTHLTDKETEAQGDTAIFPGYMASRWEPGLKMDVTEGKVLVLDVGHTSQIS